MMHTARPRSHSSLKLLTHLLIWSVLSTLFLHHYVFAVYIIKGTSMAPTLNDGDTAVVNMFFHNLGRPQRGEIVLVRDGFRDYATKRIVGLPGELVEFKDGLVLIDGKRLPERYLHRHTQTLSSWPSFHLGPNEYFVLGDNRADSYDSRNYGPVLRSALMGSYSRSFWACR